MLDAGPVPFLEPDVDITSAHKAQAEAVLRTGLVDRRGEPDGDTRVMLKLSLPSTDGYYGDLTRHARVLRVLALSGGYGRSEANRLLAANPGVIASFSRAVIEGLTVDQSADEFDRVLDRSIGSIDAASVA